jgi:hypothetical protein
MEYSNQPVLNGVKWQNYTDKIIGIGVILNWGIRAGLSLAQNLRANWVYLWIHRPGCCCVQICLALVA